MRTRRIAIGCRRTGWASTIAIAPSAPDLLPVDLAPQPDPPAAPSTPAPLPSRLRADAHRVPAPSTPPAGEQNLTLADLTTGRRDLTWNTNPGWPDQVEIDWTRIARSHTPRHARRRLPTIPFRAFAWTGAGVITAVLLTVLVTMLSELIRQ